MSKFNFASRKAIQKGQKDLHISHEKIYQLTYQYQKVKGHICCDWHLHLPRRRRKRLSRAKLRPFKKKARPGLYMPCGLAGRRLSAFGRWILCISSMAISL